MSNTPCKSLQTGTGSILPPGKWQSLPRELVDEIVSNLDTWPALLFANSCHQFSEPGNKVAWRQVDLTLSVERFKKAWYSPNPSKAIPDSITDLWDLFRSALDAHPERKKYIRSINYHSSTGALPIASVLLPQLSNLQHIKNSNLAKLYPGEAYHYTKQDHAQTSLPLLQICGKMPKIVSLDVGAAEGSPEDLFAALHNLPNLVTLQMGLEGKETANLTLDAPDMPSLESLSFPVANWPELTAQLISKAPNLHDLVFHKISDEKLFNSNALSTILQSKQIRSLNIEHHTMDFHVGFATFPSGCLPNLDKITWGIKVSDGLLPLVIWGSHVA